MSFVVYSKFLWCDKLHDIDFLDNNDIPLGNIEGTKCVWCSEGDARSRSFRNLHEELAS